LPEPLSGSRSVPVRSIGATIGFAQEGAPRHPGGGLRAGSLAYRRATLGRARDGGRGGEMLAAIQALGLLIVGALILGGVAVVFIILRQPHGGKP